MTGHNTFLGIDSANNLSKVLEDYPEGKIFLVTGKGSYGASGAQSLIEQNLSAERYIRFFDFEQNPKIQDVRKGIDLYRSHKCTLTIAIGGGSALDIAKIINATAHSEEDVELLVKENRVSDKISDFIAIPTTSGSGSEATHFAVVYIDNAKYSFASPKLLPTYTVVDPSFTASSSLYQAACSGVDALCQSIESYWAVASTEESKDYAMKAAKLLWANLKTAVETKDLEALNKVSMGSYYAGKAINITKTTGAHAVSYPFTTYFNIPHGNAVALTIPFFIEYNASCAEMNCLDPRGPQYVEKGILELSQELGYNTIDEFKNAFIRLVNSLGLSLDFKGHGLILEQLETKVLKNINYQRASNNPRQIEPAALLEFFRSNLND